MSYDVETALITKIIEEADIKSVIRQKVTSEFFSDDTTSSVFEWLIKQYQKTGRVPSIGLTQRVFPEFDPVDTDDDLIFLVDEIKRTKLYGDIASALKEVSTKTKDDPQLGFDALRKLTSTMILTHSSTDDHDLTRMAQVARDEYANIQSSGGTIGVPYPWPCANKVTLGMHPGDLIGFYARPKSMKTWMSILLADHAHREYGVVPGFFSCEMPIEQIRRRLVAIRTGINYARYRSGKLTKKEYQSFEDGLIELEESPPFMFLKVEGTGASAIAEIKAKTEEHELGLVIVDGAYFLMEDEGWRSFIPITRGLKRIAETMKIPVVMTTQANRSAEKTKGQSTTELAFGDALVQDCDQLFRLIREQQHKEAKELLITMPAVREAEGCTFAINAIPASDFSEKHVYEGDEAEQAVQDTDEGMIV